jgi:transcriptional regulator with XRE-family HTH domain
MSGVISAMPKAERLRDVRISRYLSQRMLAERSGVSRATIARLERGEEAHFETLWKLAEALGVEPGELAGES